MLEITHCLQNESNHLSLIGNLRNWRFILSPNSVGASEIASLHNMFWISLEAYYWTINVVHTVCIHENSMQALGQTAVASLHTPGFGCNITKKNHIWLNSCNWVLFATSTCTDMALSPPFWQKSQSLLQQALRDGLAYISCTLSYNVVCHLHIIHLLSHPYWGLGHTLHFVYYLSPTIYQTKQSRATIFSEMKRRMCPGIRMLMSFP